MRHDTNALPGPTVPPTLPPTLAPVAIPRAEATLDPRFGIAEGFRNPAVMAEIGAGWERVVLAWDQIQPDGPGDFSWLGRTLPSDSLEAEIRRGVRMAGLLQFTPAWAATNPRDPGRSVPKNLDLPFDHPDNYWGRFVFETARYYRGRIDEWIIWNEPEFRADDEGAGGSFSWLGTDAEFARLIEVGYRAIKRANPDAVVSFPGTSYWIEELASPKRAQFYERFLRLVADDPAARAAGFYHDAVSLNLYRAPDDLARLHRTFKQVQARYNVDKPLWLLELNAMPTADPQAPCAERHAAGPIKTTLEQQAAYGIQALALAAGVGYERISFYKMVDGDACAQEALWGVTRDDGSRRPVATALKTAVTHLAGYTRAQFVPRVRPTQAWPAWPEDPTSYTPNWQIYQVVFELPAGRQVTVLWNGDGVLHRVRVPKRGTSARLVEWTGTDQPLAPAGADWLIELPAATARFPADPPGYHFIGGAPLLLVEDGVSAPAAVTPPRLS